MSEDHRSWGTASTPPVGIDRDEGWREFDNSVNAVSFGFVATAVLISMFLVMAIFERFLRGPRSSSSSSPSSSAAPSDVHVDLEAVHLSFSPKLDPFPSPKVTRMIKSRKVLGFFLCPIVRKRVRRKLKGFSGDYVLIWKNRTFQL